jgi:hypothetical protein
MRTCGAGLWSGGRWRCGVFASKGWDYIYTPPLGKSPAEGCGFGLSSRLGFSSSRATATFGGAAVRESCCLYPLSCCLLSIFSVSPFFIWFFRGFDILYYGFILALIFILLS